MKVSEETMYSVHVGPSFYLVWLLRGSPEALEAFGISSFARHFLGGQRERETESRFPVKGTREG